MASRLGLWVNMVRTFLVPLRGKFCGKYLARYLNMGVGGGARLLRYVSCVMKVVELGRTGWAGHVMMRE